MSMHTTQFEPSADSRTRFLVTNEPRFLLGLNALMAVVYFCVLTFLFRVGNPVLFTLLIMGEVFHVWQVLTYIYTVWDTSYESPMNHTYTPAVDVFITVAGEPIEIVEETLRAALAIDYPHFVVTILNDGFVAKKDNWKEVEMLAAHHGAHCITRKIPGGYKAGNINNALSKTNGALVAVFDADHVPYPSFLKKTVPYFGAANVGFVQTPQYYKNYEKNFVTRSSWEQQELFFGAICKGKNRLNAATMCGTNMLISREAINAVGGMCTESIAEDFITGMFIHQLGYTSVYVPEVLAEGLATEDLETYNKQQFRWARGALDMLFSYNPLFNRGLTWQQKIQYIASASFYLSGTVVVMDALLPLCFFFFGTVPLFISGMVLATVFLPYLFLTLYTIQRTTNFTFTFRSLAFSTGAFTIHLSALLSTVLKRRTAFIITNKRQVKGNFLPLVRMHIVYIAIAVVGVGFAFLREGLDPSLINNIAWGSINTALLIPFIYAALPQKNQTAISLP
jgi:cellulose synthase (UDP-forming)